MAAELELVVRYKDKPPTEFLAKFQQLVDSHPELELCPVICVPKSSALPTRKHKRVTSTGTSTSTATSSGAGTTSGADTSTGVTTSVPPPKRRKKGPSGYDTSKTPVLDGECPCPYCHLAPCIIARPPSWLRGSASADLGNITKRFKLYGRFWTLLGQLGVWNHPLYLEYKLTKTAIHDKRDVMPDCVLREIRGRFPNPDGVPYTDFQPTSRYIA